MICYYRYRGIFGRAPAWQAREGPVAGGHAVHAQDRELKRRIPWRKKLR